MDFKVGDYLGNYNKATDRGNCKGCGKDILWKREKLASHKRVSCLGVTEDEKEIFAKKAKTSANTSSSNQIDASNISDDVIGDGDAVFAVVPVLTPELKAEIDDALAMLCFRTGVPFRFLDSAVFRRFVELLNPQYAKEMPKSRTVSGVLLDKQYDKSQAKLHDVLTNSKNLTLISDGWTNVRSDHIVNFLVKAPGQPSVFYKSINTSGIIQDTDAVSEAICEVLEEIGAANFVSFVSDNAPVLKAAHKQIERRYPHITAYGCAAHALNLLIKDILEPSLAGMNIQYSLFI